MKAIFFIAMLATPLNGAMVPTVLKQFTTIKPFLNGHAICTIKKVINIIKTQQLTYPDYSQRTGIILILLESA